MRHSLPYAEEIVDLNVRGATVVGRLIHEDQGNPPKLRVSCKRLLHAKGHHGDTVHAALHHASNRKSHPLWIMHGRTEQDFVVVRDRNVLERLYDLREERIGYFTHDQAEDAGASGNECARLYVGVKTCPLYDVQHASCQLRVNRGSAIQGA